MRSPVSSFELPVRDLDRAVAFHGAVFGDGFERVGIDGNEMALFPAVSGTGGISGALVRGESYVPGRRGARLYFAVGSIEETLGRVEAAGGRVLYPRTSIGKSGWVVEFGDSEGSCVALHSRS
ncbi:VOC family protein [Deinococcus sp. YIM 134068]|uniref:VOC family protein n=1 Tax=Deinococcus lichenicola TaxID=3118910 RepID=UPI002F942757